MEQSRFFLMLTITCILVVIVVSIQFFIEYRRSTRSIMNKTKKDTSVNGSKFPPSPSKCPDYWTTLSNGKCKNTRKIGICKTKDGANVMDFNSNEIFKGEDGPLAKCNWSKQCEAPWEGIDTLC